MEKESPDVKERRILMIELKGIRKVFNKGTSTENVAINNVNLLLNSGDFVTIIGGNGAGKSTLLNIVAGSLEADEGLILLNNNDVSRLKEHKRAPYFGRVFQDTMMGTAADMTVLENLSLAYGRGKMRSLFRWSIHQKDKEYFIEQLKSLGLGLENRLTQKVGLLSGGQRQALTLLMATIRQEPSHRVIKRDYIRFFDGDKKQAKADFEKAFSNAKAEWKKSKEEIKESNLSKEEKTIKLKEAYKVFDTKVRVFDLTKPVLLLDEHTAALDPATAAKVLEITKRIVKEQNLTTIMITHNMKDAIRYGNRLVMMSKGNIVVDVSGEEKQKLTIEQLLNMFNEASKNDMLADSAILGD